MHTRCLTEWVSNRSSRSGFVYCSGCEAGSNSQIRHKHTLYTQEWWDTSHRRQQVTAAVCPQHPPNWSLVTKSERFIFILIAVLQRVKMALSVREAVSGVLWSDFMVWLADRVTVKLQSSLQNQQSCRNKWNSAVVLFCFTQIHKPT